MGLSFSAQGQMKQQDEDVHVSTKDVNTADTPSSRMQSHEVQAAKRKLFQPASPTKETNDIRVKLTKRNSRSSNLQQIRIVPWNNSALCSFFKIFDDEKVQNFLWSDPTARICDKYLLAMVYTYFLRADLNHKEYNRGNFFVALFLAHDMEEDDEDIKYEIFPWCLGKQWKRKISLFLQRKDHLWSRMNHRSLVSCQTCDEVMQLCPTHPIWRRERRVTLGGAIDPLVTTDTISVVIGRENDLRKPLPLSHKLKCVDSPACCLLAKRTSTINSMSTTENGDQTFQKQESHGRSHIEE